MRRAPFELPMRGVQLRVLFHAGAAQVAHYRREVASGWRAGRNAVVKKRVRSGRWRCEISGLAGLLDSGAVWSICEQ